MYNIFERHRAFKESIGSFILAFSEMEFGLAILCSFTEFDLFRREDRLAHCIGLALDNKKRMISEYLNRYEPELIPKWDKIKQEIEFLNGQRRFIAHGIQSVYVSDSLSAVIKVGSQLEHKDLTIDEVNGWTTRLHHVNTGENGVIGAFYGEFVTASINRWNRHVIEEYRIVYKVDSTIVSDWKG